MFFRNDRIYVLLVDDFYWFNGCFRALLYVNWNVVCFISWCLRRNVLYSWLYSFARGHLEAH